MKKAFYSWHGWAALWGFAEATLFFIVPDVLLTFVATKRPGLALRCCFSCAIGAVIGGAFMASWGQSDLAGATEVLERVPAIHASMIEDAAIEMQADGNRAMFLAPLKLRAYKLYALQAGAAEWSPARFIAVSFLARLPRFLISVGAVSVVVGLTGRWLTMRWRVGILTAFWLTNYALYFRAFL